MSGAFVVGTLVLGLTLGSVYAIVALGYTMVYGIIELINFAHGDVFVFGALVAIPVLERFVAQNGQNIGFAQSVISIGVAMLISAVACGVLGLLIERVAYRRLRNAPRLAPLITAIGVSFIIENLMSQWVGGEPVQFPTVMNYWSFNLLGSPVTNYSLVVIFGAGVMMFAVDLFVNRTGLGKAMRAVAQDREAAAMMGISVDGIISLTFFVGSFLAGAGSILYGIENSNVTWNDGFTLGLYAFTAAVLGGIGNIRGAVLGALIIGILSAYVQQLGQGVGTSWYDSAIFSVLVLILVFRPAGILGTNTAEKV